MQKLPSVFSVRSLSGESRLTPQDSKQLEILKRVKVMLITKMEKLVLDEGNAGPVSDKVDEISASLLKVEDQIRQILEKNSPKQTTMVSLFAADGCLTERGLPLSVGLSGTKGLVPMTEKKEAPKETVN